MNAYQLGLIMMACISVINVCGVFSITGLAGMFSLGQAAYMCLGAYITFVSARVLSLPALLCAILALAVCALLAWIVSIPTLKLRTDYFALMTVGFSQMIMALVILFPDLTNGSIGFSKIPKVEHLFWIVVGVTVLVVFCVRNLKYSRFGRMCIALKTDPIAARSFGIDVYKVKIMVYIFASVVAGIAGIFFALRNRVITPDAFNWAASAEMQIFLFFGGTNSLSGSVISAFFLKLMPEAFRGVNLFGQSLQEFRTIIYCIMILLVINFRPKGLLGESELSLEALRNKIASLKSQEKENRNGNEKRSENS